MSSECVPFTELLAKIIDNRGKTCPVGNAGVPLIATNCVSNNSLYPTYDTTRFVDEETYRNWFRGHPEPGDILFVCKGSPGRTNWVPDPVDFCIAQDMVAVRANPGRIYPKYLFAALRSSIVQSQIDNMHVGTMIPHFKKGDFDKLKIPVPSGVKQEFIGDLYFIISERIALLRETNATLEAIAQALFKSWFVDFDPVHANAGTQPSTLATELQTLFPTTFTDTPQGPVPEGWRVDTLESISEILNGFAFKSEDYVNDEDGVFVLRTTNFNSDGYATRLEKDVFLPESFIASHAKFVCQPFDFHLVMVGASVGNTSLLLPHMLPALRNQNMWCFRPRADFPSKFFIHEIVKMNVAEALRSTSGSAREFLRKGDFGLGKVVLPPENILMIFEEQLQTIKDSIANNAVKAQTLATLRDTLLPRLISGQLRLPDAEAALAEVV